MRFKDLDGSQLGAVRPIADSAAEAQADPTSEHVLTYLERTEKVNAQGVTYYHVSTCSVNALCAAARTPPITALSAGSRTG